MGVVTIRTTEEDEKLLEEIKALTGKKASSQALLSAAQMALEMSEVNSRHLAILAVQDNEIRRLKEVVDNAREAGLRLYEATAQTDLLSDID